MSALTRYFVFIAAAAASSVSAQTAPPAMPVSVPSYNVYLADLQGHKISQVKQVNTTTGYHNQPEFSADGSLLYFTSQQGSGDKSQMDIARFEIQSGKLDIFHATTLSEYSPTRLPGEQALSAVVVEADGKQRLWRLPIAGAPAVLLADVAGVGYHAWGPSNDVLLFILGKDEADHQIAYRNAAGDVTTLAKNIGRALAWRPGTQQGYFTERAGDRLALRQFDSQTGQTSAPLLLLPEQAQDVRWWSKEVLITSAEQTLYSWQAGSQSWQRWLDLSAYCQGTLSRFSFSVDHKQLAFVCQPPAAKP